MTLYEELGVDPSASPEGIRHAYRLLARLLHPDHLSDEELRPLAEIQMKRLHQIVAVLTDPEARGEYDAGLHPLPAPRPRDFAGLAPGAGRFHVRPALLVWIGTALSAMAAIASFYYLAQPSIENPLDALRSKPAEAIQALPESSPNPPAQRSSPAGQAVHSTEAAFDIEKADVVRNLRRQLNESQTEYQDALLQIGRLRSQNTPASISQNVAIRPPEASEPVVEAKAKAPPDTASSLGFTFTGNWLYVPSAVPDSGPNHLYPPEYIELRAAEQGGVIRGHYRGRYKVTDLAISPNVEFQFEGPVAGNAAQLHWTGQGGAKGQVILTLAPDGGLQVRWTANRLSRELSLTSGVATLVRLRQ
ncbi:MAG TPA: J domain-containing protein [Candidatus Acidoferrales bacterium]|jgi:curved DNA-binding protein CbpA|nr:J domain-containing protein [Candidatus Acidoferrales bacterium]